MRQSPVSRGGMPQGHKYSGWWGNLGSPIQKGMKEFTISHYQVNPMQGALRQYLWGGYTRLLHQIPYFAVPLAAAYGLITYAVNQNHYLNSKAGLREASENENLQ